MKKFALFAFALLFASSAHALTITATEILKDTKPFDLFDRDLRREMSDTTGFSQVVNNDAAIVTSNNVDGDFGFYNNDNVTYRHNLTWLAPPAASFLNMTLTILAFGADGGNDTVVAESLNLGSIVPDGTILEWFSTTIFSNASPITLNAIFADGYLNVVIDKNAGQRNGGSDLLSIYESRLDVTYEPVPEPGTLALLGLAGAAGVLRRRRLSDASN